MTGLSSYFESVELFQCESRLELTFGWVSSLIAAVSVLIYIYTKLGDAPTNGNDAMLMRLIAQGTLLVQILVKQFGFDQMAFDFSFIAVYLVRVSYVDRLSALIADKWRRQSYQWRWSVLLGIMQMKTLALMHLFGHKECGPSGERHVCLLAVPSVLAVALSVETMLFSVYVTLTAADGLLSNCLLSTDDVAGKRDSHLSVRVTRPILMSVLVSNVVAVVVGALWYGVHPVLGLTPNPVRFSEIVIILFNAIHVTAAWIPELVLGVSELFDPQPNEPATIELAPVAV